MKQEIRDLAKAMANVNKDPLVYIASPFFDEQSKEYVTCKETEFEGMGVPYYSPRQDGINFNEVSGQLRSERIQAIFKNNVRNLKKCKHICVNLLPCNGRLDIGTLWELGYFVGLNGDIDFEDDEYNTLLATPETKDLVLEILNNLKKVTIEPFSNNSKILYTKSVNIKRVEDSLDLIDAKYQVKEVSSTLANLVFAEDDKHVFLTDEFPMQLFILMGFMYARDIKYYTASFKGFGSNVMIAASSRGHIQLPGLVDDTYNNNMH